MRPEGQNMRTIPSPLHAAFRQMRLCSRLCVVGVMAVVQDVRAADIGKTYPTPEAAVTALAKAAHAGDRDALREIFGPSVDDISNADPVQATNEVAGFAASLAVTNRLVRESDTRCVIEVGKDLYPFPIPIVRKDGAWFFDTEAGKEELLNRRIGRNELSTLATVRAYVDAQREYASRDRNDDEVLEYAQQFISSPGKRDGLYWSPDLDGEISPLGPLVANAQTEGYLKNVADEDRRPQPYQGYYFRILTHQGSHAPGGKYNFVINGRMIAGFALVAWPAEYGDSGIMTFIVNQQGKVYQKDLGPNTAKLASSMKHYDPDPSWQLSRE